MTASGSVVAGPDQRRSQMLLAAAELIAERGFTETRIADVARRAGVSSGLVIYYFGTKDKLLTEALRFSEEAFYTASADLLAQTGSVRERLEVLVRLTCIPQGTGEVPGAWGLWFDLWAQAFRHPEVSKDRIELDQRWRETIAGVLRDGQRTGEIAATVEGVEDFAVTFAALLDGLSIQVALADPVVDEARALGVAMGFADRSLGLAPARRSRAAPAAQPATAKRSAPGAKRSASTKLKASGKTRSAARG